MKGWRPQLAQKLPFYYGWIVFGASIMASWSARPLMSIATLTVFVVPMTMQFGWSRGLFSGAVSLGGVFAMAISPLVGRILDRHGSGATVAVSSAVIGLCSFGLAAVTQAWTFYALYVPARMFFASPLELGTSLALTNWFIRRRSFALALLSIGQGAGLALMPLAAQFMISGWGWRAAWIAMGTYTLTVGVLPALVFMVRRPEDIGLEPDPPRGVNRDTRHPQYLHEPDNLAVAGRREVHFTLGEAVRTPTFWVLSIFSVAGFLIQSGVSLHQVPHFIGQGLAPSQAVFTASNFALSQVFGGLIWSALSTRIPVRFLLAGAGVTAGVGAIGTSFSSSLSWGIASSLALGVGVGGLHLLLRLAWADYYGRRHLGSIRGVAHSAQIGGQVLGPILAGFLFDATRSYRVPFTLFTALIWAASLLVLAAAPPRPPARPTAGLESRI